MNLPPSSPAPHRYDVVVVGGGASGLVAALRAAHFGATVGILEAATESGGTTKRSSGGYWVPNNSWMRARGVEDPEEDAIRYMARVAYPTLFDDDAPHFGIDERDFELLRSLYAKSSEAVDWLAENGYLASTEMVGFNGKAGEFPPYNELPEFDRAPFGRHLGPMYTTESAEIAKTEVRRAQGGIDPEAGTPGDGGELARQLQSAAAKLGVKVHLEHRASEILQDEDGRVTGVRATTPHGTTTFEATRGVVFTTGGFSQNREMSDKLLRGPIAGTGAVPTGMGDFISLTEKLDVELANTENAWWAQVPLEPALDNRNMDWLAFVPFGDSMIIANREGKRVVNEKLPYDSRGRAHFIGGAEQGWPNRILMMIYDNAVAQNPLDWQPRWPVPLPEGRLTVRASDIDERDLVISGQTLDALAANVQAKLAELADKTDGFTLDEKFANRLAETIASFNEAAHTGVDEEFRRGETAVEVGMSGPGRESSKNSTMAPFQAEGPYHCILLAAGTLDTKGGPRIDTQARVLRSDGTPIPALYGAGNCVAQPTGEGYFSGGATLGSAITFGYIAGEHAAAG